MSCCCTDFVDAGCFSACDTITLTGYLASQTGVHQVEVYLGNDVWQAEDVTYTATNTITIPGALLNEAGPHDVKIKQPDGVYYDFITDVDCIRITTQIHMSLGIVT